MLIVLIDDVGFGWSYTFGGPFDPNGDRLADGGLRYTRFHTTALCSPPGRRCSRGATTIGVGIGVITEIATSAPGYNSLRPNTTAPLAMTLKLNGYSTAQFGKCHEVPVWDPRRSVRSTPGRRASAGSRRSTASSAARPTSARWRCTTGHGQWSPPAPPRSGPTSPRT